MINFKDFLFVKTDEYGSGQIAKVYQLNVKERRRACLLSLVVEHVQYALIHIDFCLVKRKGTGKLWCRHYKATDGSQLLNYRY